MAASLALSLPASSRSFSKVDCAAIKPSKASSTSPIARDMSSKPWANWLPNERPSSLAWSVSRLSSARLSMAASIRANSSRKRLSPVRAYSSRRSVARRCSWMVCCSTSDRLATKAESKRDSIRSLFNARISSLMLASGSALRLASSRIWAICRRAWRMARSVPVAASILACRAAVAASAPPDISSICRFRSASSAARSAAAPVAPPPEPPPVPPPPPSEPLRPSASFRRSLSASRKREMSGPTSSLPSWMKSARSSFSISTILEKSPVTSAPICAARAPMFSPAPSSKVVMLLKARRRPSAVVATIKSMVSDQSTRSSLAALRSSTPSRASSATFTSTPPRSPMNSAKPDVAPAD